ncbi:MAG: GNAT family N-acetyltransferase [Promethearchaeota archaeon]
MTLRIIYQPSQLIYPEFKLIEHDCFPEAPLDEIFFSEIVSQDFWGAYLDDKFVGYIYLAQRSGFPMIYRVGIYNIYRQQGIGKMLVQKAIDHCYQIKKPKIFLYVQKKNTVAIKLYENFGFQKKESFYQYIVPIKEFFSLYDKRDSCSLTASPIKNEDLAFLPQLSEEWSNLPSFHDPPRNYVLIFKNQQDKIQGFCRLNPNFSGCFPFIIRSQYTLFPEFLFSLKEYINPDKTILKLTFSDQNLVNICKIKKFRLNQESFKMEKELEKEYPSKR